MNSNNSSIDKEQLEALNALIDEISKSRKLQNIEIFNKAMNDIKKKAELIPLLNIQKFSLSFYQIYNNLVIKEPNQYAKKLIKLADSMLLNFKKENLLNMIQNEINMNFLEDFKTFKIFNDKLGKKDDFESCFAICIISKNISLMKIFFIKYLKVSAFTEENFNSINLENPYALKLFDSIFNKIYNNKIVIQSSELNSLVQKCINDSNQTLFNMFRCDKCYDIMDIQLNEQNNFDIQCSSCNKKYKSYEEFDLNKTILLSFICNICKNKLLLYKENYKCTQCKNLFCSKCKNKHLENCLSLNCIKLYDVSYRCESHCYKFIDYCFFCRKNLCKMCIEIHPHKVKDVNKINKILDNKMKEFIGNYGALKEKDLLKTINNPEITKNLIYIYKAMKVRKLFNGHIISILCKLLNIDLQEYKKGIMFKEFNNKEFIKYYSELINKINNGNGYYLNCLNSIKSIYIKKSKKIIDFGFNISNLLDKERHIQSLIENSKSIWKDLSNNHIFINYESRMNKLRLSNNNLKIKISELNSRILQLENSNKIQQENTHNILCRFLSEKLLETIIINFYHSLDPISLNLNILIDLISKSNYDILSNDKLLNMISKISTELSDKLNKLKNNPADKGLKEEILNSINLSSKIRFSKDLFYKNNIFKKQELNKIIDILFYIKDFGNVTAHPNINLDESLKMLSFQNLPINFEIEYFYNNKLKEQVDNKINTQIEINSKSLGEILPRIMLKEEDNYYHLNEFNIKMRNDYDILKNIEQYRKGINNEVIEKIKEVVGELLKNLNICKLKKEAKTEDIMDTIFKDKDKNIFEESINFIGIFLSNTEDIMKKYLVLDLEKEIINQNKIINDLIQTIEGIFLFLRRFIKLNIPRHNNLEEYINNIKENNNNVNYNDYIQFIINFENSIFYENNLNADCEKNEIILEACFLLMIKTIENEIKYLKSIKKKCEMEIIENLVYEDIEHKLNDICKLFNERFNANTSFQLSKSIKDKFKINDSDEIKNILTKLIGEKISFDEDKNSKLNLNSKLFYYQNK